MPDFSELDLNFMKRALCLAMQGEYTARPNPLVGAVLVRNNQIIGEGAHLKAGLAHAEINALKDAKQRGEDPKGSTCYVTLEPCAHWGKTGPCVDELINAGVARVVFAMQDPNPKVCGQSELKLKQARICVEKGLCEAESRSLNLGFLAHMESQKCYVRAKIAASLDGKIALSNGQSQWITGEKAREDVHKLRAKSSVIITGIGTVLADNPKLNVRLESLLNTEKFNHFTQPHKIICDSQARLINEIKNIKNIFNIFNIFNTDLNSQVFIAHANSAFKDQKFVYSDFNSPIELLYFPSETSPNKSDYPNVDLKKLLSFCYSQNWNDVLVEAGSTLTSSFFNLNLIDELWLYLAPCFLGAQSQPMLKNFELENLMQAHGRWKFSESFQYANACFLGKDLRIVLSHL